MSAESSFVTAPSRIEESIVEQTESKTQTTNTHVQRFLDDYRESVYEELAHRAAYLIRSQLEVEAKKPFEHRLEAKVSSRGKMLRSLSHKLNTADKKRAFRSVDDIKRRIHDLAGVRIVLYMPSEAQRQKAAKVLATIWGKDIKRKRRPPSKVVEQHSPDDARVHQRMWRHYEAEHYIARMTEKLCCGQPTVRKYDKVEIQVTSAMSHAWAEAQHDVVYKSLQYGKPTPRELSIIDCLGDLVSASNKLMQSFHDLYIIRLFRPWPEAVDLHIYLRDLDVFKNTETSPNPYNFAMDHVEVLLRFLEMCKQNYPVALRAELEHLGLPNHAETCISDIVRSFSTFEKLTSRGLWSKEHHLLISLMCRFLDSQFCAEAGAINEEQIDSDEEEMNGQDFVSLSDYGSNRTFTDVTREEDFLAQMPIGTIDELIPYQDLQPCTRPIFTMLLLLDTIFGPRAVTLILQIELNMLPMDEDDYRMQVVESFDRILAHRWEFAIDKQLELKEDANTEDMHAMIGPAWNFCLRQAFCPRATAPLSLSGLMFTVSRRGYRQKADPERCAERFASIRRNPSLHKKRNPWTPATQGDTKT